jgi:hypothetical protein
MRHSDRWLRLALLAALLLGLPITLSAIEISRHGDGGWPSFVLGLSLALEFFLLVFAILMFKNVRLARRIRRPDRQIASWTVSPEIWAAFLARDAARAAEAPKLLRAFKPRPGNALVEVIAAQGAILIDGVVIGVEPRGLDAVRGVSWLSGRPECLEFRCVVPVTAGRVLRAVPGWFRIPVPPASREAGEVAFAAYTRSIARGELSDPRVHRLFVHLCIGLALLLLPVGGLGIAMMAAGIMDDRQLPFVLAIIGCMGSAGAALVAFIVWLAMPRARK